jgi:predicted dehydrogenase/threonine dehydrogenase-like Zn-dependent dehydrogenase
MVNDGSIQLIETPIPKVKDNFLIIETLYSVVSTGTERTLTEFGNKNIVQKAIARPDQFNQVLDKISTDGFFNTLDGVFNKLKDPMPIGYSAVGRVLEVGNGISNIFSGDIVAMAGQAYHSEVNRVNQNLVVKLPTNFPDIKQASLCALGAIALQGIHQAKVEPGETIGIIGLGLLGHITARILIAYGCTVIGYDISNKSLDKTQLESFIFSNDQNAESITKSLTKNRGVDKVIITAATDSNEPMDLAASIARDRGTICMIGVTKMNIDRRPYYEKELTFTIARSYGPGRYNLDYEDKGIDFPIGLVRFTEGRNLEEFIRLISEKKVDFTDLITHEIDFENAEQAYEIITTNKKNEKYIAILLKYSDYKDKLVNKIINKHTIKKSLNKDKINLGLIGAGNFARNTLLPFMNKSNLYNFIGLATTGGPAGAQANKLYNFNYATNNYRDLLNDYSIDLIVITTQHNTHAEFIIQALNSGKHVYCEKPLCLTLEDLERIKNAYQHSEGELFVGLNRRHSTLIKTIRNKLYTHKNSSVYEYICNAGFINDDHWSQDDKTGGGRILGEAIHFIDVIQSLDGSRLTSLDLVYANNDSYPKNDNAIINLKFESGSIASIIYTSMGSKKYSKEQLRVFVNGQVYEMDNYLKLNMFGNFKKSSFYLRQDKGFKSEYEYIHNVLKGIEKNEILNDAFISHELLLKKL